MEAAAQDTVTRGLVVTVVEVEGADIVAAPVTGLLVATETEIAEDIAAEGVDIVVEGVVMAATRWEGLATTSEIFPGICLHYPCLKRIFTLSTLLCRSVVTVMPTTGDVIKVSLSSVTGYPRYCCDY